jgi:hypothetical protein
VYQLPNLSEVLLGMVPESPSSNRNQQRRLCWVLLWSYKCVLTSLAVSIMLYCPTVGKECVHVYFSGSVASWHPVLSVVIGQCVTITGLQRKLILVGPEKNEHFLLWQKRVAWCHNFLLHGVSPWIVGGKSLVLGQEKGIQPLAESQEQLFTRN